MDLSRAHDVTYTLILSHHEAEQLRDFLACEYYRMDRLKFDKVRDLSDELDQTVVND